MPEVALILLEPFVKSAEVHDDVLAECVIVRSKSRRSPFGARDAQVQRRSFAGMHRDGNAGVIDGAIAETRDGDAGRPGRAARTLGGGARNSLELLPTSKRISHPPRHDNLPAPLFTDRELANRRSGRR